MKGKGKNNWLELIGIERNNDAFLIVSGKGRVLQPVFTSSLSCCQ